MVVSVTTGTFACTAGFTVFPSEAGSNTVSLIRSARPRTRDVSARHGIKRGRISDCIINEGLARR
ncbi:MAG TPA: growth inhibitor PemK [Leclercia adecarboxylata]|nr:growth inhibitor PemK [Leclercia adecarboxylata]